MGYTTNFNGKFNITPTLSLTDYKFLEKLGSTRRMKRKMGPEYGVDGEFYVDDQLRETVVDFNKPPQTQPGLWCQWVPTEDGNGLEWDGNEKFYNYVEWLQYIINWLKPKGYIVNGEVTWEGEDSSDLGKIVVNNNNIQILEGSVTYKPKA